MSKQKNLAMRIVIFSVIMIGILLAMRLIANAGQTSEKYDAFAQCLAAKDVKFYGAFWCTHCADQKREFDAAVKYLPYVECSTPDGKAENKTCTDANISGYPTWVFPDGSRLNGPQSLPALAAQSGCALPSADGTSLSN